MLPNLRPKFRSRLMRVSVPSLAVALLLSCGEDEGPSTPEPGPPPTLRIAALFPRGDAVWLRETDDRPRDPEPVVVGCDRRLGVEVDLDVWLLRAPGGCGAIQNCGSLIVSVGPLAGGPAARTEAVLSRALLDVEPLGAALDGAQRVRVELRGNDGRIFRGQDGEPVADELEVELARESCAPGGGGGGQGSGGESGESGESGEPGAGAGGAGGGS